MGGSKFDTTYSVYVHVFPNGKKYFGITRQDPEKRWAKGLDYRQKIQPRMHNAIVKYGWNSVTHIVLLTGLSRAEATSLEIKLIASGNTTDPRYGYNMTPGGDGPQRWTEEMREKIRRAQTGRRHSPERRARIGAAQIGRKLSEEHKVKLRAAHLGKVVSPEVRANMSLAQKKRFLSPEARAKMRGVLVGRARPPETKAKIIAANKRRALRSSTSI